MITSLDLTDRFPFKFDVERMKADLAKLSTSGWLDHYDPGLSSGWRAILLVSKHGQMSGPESQRPAWDSSEFRRTPIVDELPYFREILDFFQCPQGRMRILKLAPGAYIGKHTDRDSECGCLAFNRVRLHVPIQTNDKVTFFVGGQKLKLLPGRFYYVNFSQAHHVKNEGTEDRLHLVMDLEVNDWLRQFFPKFSTVERLEYALVRATYPIFWKIYWPKQLLKTWFWRQYNGSLAQRTVHRMRSARQT